ncbi:MAG TPA: hypothetical protein VER37_04685 [Thermomicrobiales bacterium]|nr:hypothetical protein [Thermomicrobiales bacterium]
MTEPIVVEARLAAASFVIEALGLGLEIDSLVGDIRLIEERPDVTTLAFEMDSDAGPLAFLVYAYLLDWVDEPGTTGRTGVERAVAMLSQAERLDAPGPRAVATGEVGRWGLVLATTPDGAERLAGSEPRPRWEDAGEATEPSRDPAELAGDLLASLRRSNRLASEYLARIGPSGMRATLEEAELALYLTDGRSLTPLLALIRRTVEIAEAGN